MSANIFILCWIICGLLNIFIFPILRKKYDRATTLNKIDEIFTCLKYGPMLFFAIPLGIIELTEEEKEAKRIEKEKIRKAKQIIRTRFEILDL